SRRPRRARAPSGDLCSLRPIRGSEFSVRAPRKRPWLRSIPVKNLHSEMAARAFVAKTGTADTYFNLLRPDGERHKAADLSDMTRIGTGRAFGAHVVEEVVGYRLERRLGEGGMSEVWAATDMARQRAVALKMLLPKARANVEIVARFRREAELLRRIDSDH